MDLVQTFVGVHGGSQDANLLAEAGVFRAALPKTPQLRVYLHCATITHLYSVYESFVADAVTEYLRELQKLLPYRKLNKILRTAHIVGLGRVLQRIKSRYRYLDSEKVLSDLYQLITKRGKGNIAPEAFFDKDANLRYSQLNSLLKRCALHDVHNWIVQHESMRTYVIQVRGGSVDPIKELDQFVMLRNEATHDSRNVLEPFGKTALLEYIELIDALCRVLTEYIDHEILIASIEGGQASCGARITNVFPKVGALGIIAKDVKITVGDSLWALGNRYCYLTQVKSIHENKTSVPYVQAGAQEVQLGIVLDPSPPRECKLVVRA